MKRILACGLLASILIFHAGCEAKKEIQSASSEDEGTEQNVTREVFAMDTYMSVTATGVNAVTAVDEAIAEIERLDRLWSVGSAESEISIINKSGEGVLSEDGKLITKLALSLYGSTGGAFDISIYPLMELWGFTGDEPSLPDKEEIKETLKHCGADKLDFDEESGLIRLSEGMGVDLGGIAKGYASNRIMEIFKEHDISSGIVSLGGNVQCYGTKPDGEKWRCGIVDPLRSDEPSAYIGIIKVEDKAVITSGGYERFFIDEESGEVYHHIMDPATGYPAENGLISVTIVSRDGALADGLSTSIFIMGLDKAAEYWAWHSESFDMVLMDEDGRVYISEGIKDDFLSDYPFEVITADKSTSG